MVRGDILEDGDIFLLSKLRLMVALDSPRSFLAVTLYFPASSTCTATILASVHTNYFPQLSFAKDWRKVFCYSEKMIPKCYYKNSKDFCEIWLLERFFCDCNVSTPIPLFMQKNNMPKVQVPSWPCSLRFHTITIGLQILPIFIYLSPISVRRYLRDFETVDVLYYKNFS